jgi:hypothetical protein
VGPETSTIPAHGATTPVGSKIGKVYHPTKSENSKVYEIADVLLLFILNCLAVLKHVHVMFPHTCFEDQTTMPRTNSIIEAHFPTQEQAGKLSLRQSLCRKSREHRFDPGFKFTGNNNERLFDCIEYNDFELMMFFSYCSSTRPIYVNVVKKMS